MDRTAHTLSVPRTARFWTREPQGDGHAGTLYVLHGYGQLPQYFIRKFQSAVEAGWRVIAPEGAHRFYLQGTEGRVGASWMTKEARLDDIADQMVYLDRLRDHVEEEGAVGPSVLLGFSQGASTALRWAALGRRGAASWDGLIAHSGVIPPDLHTMDGDLSAGPALDLIVGDCDPYLDNPSARFRTAEAAWADAGGQSERIRLHTFQGGHDVDSTSVDRILQGLTGQG